jgi:hypothetical protein
MKLLEAFEDRYDAKEALAALDRGEGEALNWEAAKKELNK